MILESGLQWTTKGSSLVSLLRTLESKTEIYSGIHYNIWSLNRDYNRLQRGVVSGLQRITRNYTEGYIIIYGP